MSNAVESAFQAALIKKLREMFPGCMILKNDPNYLQGVPDLLMLYRDRWAALECKADHAAKERPNQRFYVSMMNAMSFASFIFPENEEAVLHELQLAFGSGGATRVSRRQQVSLDQLRRRAPSRVVPQRSGSQTRD